MEYSHIERFQPEVLHLTQVEPVIHHNPKSYRFSAEAILQMLQFGMKFGEKQLRRVNDGLHVLRKNSYEKVAMLMDRFLFLVDMQRGVITGVSDLENSQCSSIEIDNITII